MAPTTEEKGMIKRLIAKAVNKGSPARLSKGILTEPPPIPNMPLIKPATNPMRRKSTWSIETKSFNSVNFIVSNS
jgi:hypothetical protein